MRTVSVTEAKAHFSRLLADVEAGESITITQRGVPVAQLRPLPRGASSDSAAAVEAMKDFQRRNHITTGGMSIREMRDCGRH